jgi:protein-S-isoprenylcysteine O-methyltransferase Ste14
MSALELKIPPLVVVAIAWLGMWATSRLLPALTFPVAGRLWLAGAVLALGLGTLVAGVLAFAKARTTVDPLHPDASTSVVTVGIYRLTRNPMYLGMLLALTSWSILLSNLAALVFLPAFVWFIDRFQIRPEERLLRRKFGEPYLSYLASVRRWI